MTKPIKLKYRTRSKRIEIEPIECEKETESHVWVSLYGRPPTAYNKSGGYQIFHDTWQDAYDYLLKTLEEDVNNKLSSFNDAVEQLKEFRMKNKSVEVRGNYD